MLFRALIVFGPALVMTVLWGVVIWAFLIPTGLNLTSEQYWTVIAVIFALCSLVMALVHGAKWPPDDD